MPPKKRSERSKPEPPPRTPAERNAAGPLINKKRSWTVCSEHLSLAFESMLNTPVILRMIEGWEEERRCFCRQSAKYQIREVEK